MAERERPATEFTPARPRRLIAAGALALAFVAADRATKAWVLATLAQTGGTLEVLPGIVGFRFAANTGAAFSLGEGMGWLFVVLAAVMVAALLWYLATEPIVSKLEVVGLGMVLGGAVGNAIDRVALGYVVDFIATEFIDFPVFNVADIGVTVGVVLAVIGFAFLNPTGRAEGRGSDGGSGRAEEGGPDGGRIRGSR